ncbi:MAG: hypothetical protein KME55_26250 [Nostoc indistinguendum CM1-VF10]|jgi:hypothetical protein|nr:hypothetical protein [Nostoc indistinguendum CM1-VF10]
MITLENFQPWLDIPSINHVMETGCRDATTSPKALYIFMQRYVQYGRAFSISVPTLSGTIASSHLFQDPSCAISVHGDRSMDVAAKVLAASTEEFTDPKTGVSHGTLSYALLDKLAEYADLTDAEINQIAQPKSWLLGILRFVKTAYGAESDNLESIIRAIGFHVATETVGDNEFSGMIANPPYVPNALAHKMQPEVAHEPQMAVYGSGQDGLDHIRHLITFAPDYLVPGGVWLLEMMVGQDKVVSHLLERQGNYPDIQIHSDYAGRNRLALAYRV